MYEVNFNGKMEFVHALCVDLFPTVFKQTEQGYECHEDL